MEGNASTLRTQLNYLFRQQIRISEINEAKKMTLIYGSEK